MKLRAIWILICYAITNVSCAQDSTRTQLTLGFFIADSTSVADPMKISSFQIDPITLSPHKVEIRLYSYRSFQSTDIIRLSFDSYWSLDYCFKKRYTEPTTFKQVDRLDLDSVFAELVKNKLFSLPDDDSLIEEKTVLIYEPEAAPDRQFYGFGSGDVTDGNHYWLEYKVGPYYRRYHYGNPELMNDYGPFVEEYQLFTTIITILHALIPDEK